VIEEELKEVKCEFKAIGKELAEKSCDTRKTLKVSFNNM
jgi:hypothetical protein